MRKFIIYSDSARPTYNIRDLKYKGRIDILLHSIISSLFISNSFRDDTELHLFIAGDDKNPCRITISYDEENSISKKDLKKLLEMAFRKLKKGERRKVHPGVYVDDIVLEDFLKNEDLSFYYLDYNGYHIKDYLNTLRDELKCGGEIDVEEKSGIRVPCFILGDYDGVNKSLRRHLKKSCRRISLGEKMYFTSQAITIINYELDNLD